MSKESKEVAKFDEQGGELTPMTDAELAALFPKSENLTGIKPQLPQIGILHGEAQMFIMPDEKKLESFDAIILQQQHCNAWWAQSFDESGGGTPPDCSSLDSVTPDFNSPDVQAEKCSMCPKNMFGSERGKDGKPGRGKACKNMIRLHLIMPSAFPNSNTPHRLTIPPSNIKAVEAYILKTNLSGLPMQMVQTHFELAQVKSKEGIKYSGIVLTQGQRVDALLVPQIRKMLDEWLDAMKGQSVMAEI